MHEQKYFLNNQIWCVQQFGIKRRFPLKFNNFDHKLFNEGFPQIIPLIKSFNQVIFDQKGQVVEEIFQFIQEGLENGESILVHSVKGQSRSCCVIASYFMKRFKWSLYKTLEFLTSRRPDLEIRASFYHQLTNLETRFAQENGGDISASWNDQAFLSSKEKEKRFDHEEQLLRNTFLNAKNAPLDEQLINPQNSIEVKQTLGWLDIKSGDKAKLAQALNGPDNKNKISKPKSIFKSILKGSNKVFRISSDKENEQQPMQSTLMTKSSSSSGLRLNKSLKTLHEDKQHSMAATQGQYSTLLKKTVPSKMVDFSDSNTSGGGGSAKKSKTLTNSFSTNQKGGGNGSQGLPRSSSASTFERDEQSQLGFNTSADKKDSNFSNINGNIIHVTVNNFLAPMNNVNNMISNYQPTNSKEQQQSSAQKKQSSNSKDGPHMQNIINSNTNLQKKSIPQNSSTKELLSNTHGNPPANEVLGQNDSFNKILNDPNVDKNSLNYLAARQLKLALEKKLSKENNNTATSQQQLQQQVVTQNKPEKQSRMIKSSSQSSNLTKTDLGEAKENKAPRKDGTTPTKQPELKLTYQPVGIQKRGETPPPPRTRNHEDAKRTQNQQSESAYAKALAKSAISGNNSLNLNQSHSKSKVDNVQTSNYLQSLFPSSLTHLSSLTPSSSHTVAQFDKKAPSSTKATTSGNYNFGPYKTSMNLSSKYSSTQPNEKSLQQSHTQSASLIDNFMKPNSTLSSTFQNIGSNTPNGMGIPNQQQSLYGNKHQLNNYINTKQSGPVKVDHHKIERPKSANTNRSSTPNPSSNHPGRNSSMNLTGSEKKETNKSSLNNQSKVQANTLRSYSPSVKVLGANNNNNNTKQSLRKESPSAQQGAQKGNMRQRSSSPSQNPNYNTLFSTSQNKPRWKNASSAATDKSSTFKPPKKGSFKI